MIKNRNRYNRFELKSGYNKDSFWLDDVELRHMTHLHGWCENGRCFVKITFSAIDVSQKGVKLKNIRYNEFKVVDKGKKRELWLDGIKLKKVCSLYCEIINNVPLMEISLVAKDISVNY